MAVAKHLSSLCVENNKLFLFLIAQAWGQTWDFWFLLIFSLKTSNLDHSATLPPLCLNVHLNDNFIFFQLLVQLQPLVQHKALAQLQALGQHHLA